MYKYKGNSLDCNLLRQSLRCYLLTTELMSCLKTKQLGDFLVRVNSCKLRSYTPLQRKAILTLGAPMTPIWAKRLYRAYEVHTLYECKRHQEYQDML